MPKPIEVLYEDNTCLVLNKPAGLAVQGGKAVSISLDSILSEKYSPRPLLVHRLDRDTSGVILVAKTKTAAARFSALMGEGKGITKKYLAICAGRPTADSGIIRLDIDIRGSKKKSETHYKVLQSLILPQSGVPASNIEQTGPLKFSLLELELGTGRMHQIRRHLAMTGNPVLGDDKYGDFTLNKNLRKTIKLKHLLLHASRLIIPAGHQVTPLDITAPLPEYFRDFMQNTLQKDIIH